MCLLGALCVVCMMCIVCSVCIVCIVCIVYCILLFCVCVLYLSTFVEPSAMLLLYHALVYTHEQTSPGARSSLQLTLGSVAKTPLNASRRNTTFIRKHM